MIDTLRLFINITKSRGIIRRYFVVNGFDGALTMLGLVVGFRISSETDIGVVVGACTGAAIALGASGVTSAYISESAEKQRELQELERAMVADLTETAHGMASRLVPLVIAMVNGLAPFLVSMAIMTPLWLHRFGSELPAPPLDAAIVLAFVVIFLLGTFLGRVSGEFWLWSGMRAVLIAAVTAAIIFGVGS